METWFINQWNTKRREPGFEIVLTLNNIEIIGIWLNFWAIDLTLLNFTVGIALKKKEKKFDSEIKLWYTQIRDIKGEQI